MKSLIAGTECTLKEPIFCPDNGETLRTWKQHSVDHERNEIGEQEEIEINDIQKMDLPMKAQNLFSADPK